MLENAISLIERMETRRAVSCEVDQLETGATLMRHSLVRW